MWASLLLLAHLAACVHDADHDGVPEGEDCDEEDARVGTPDTWYTDADGDGFGDPATARGGCEAHADEVLYPWDCDDTRADVSPEGVEACDDADTDEDCDGAADDADPTIAGQPTWYLDVDGDGHGLADHAKVACDPGAGWVALADDCDDGDATTFPGAPEPDCTDPVDHDCDGQVAWADDDGDGWAACEDCDDGDAGVRPDAAERCDGIDQDCDGEVDEGDPVGEAWWYEDADGDGFGNPDVSVLACDPPAGWLAVPKDCDDADAAAFPGSAESDSTTLCMADDDGDGFGDADTTRPGVERGTDCADDDAEAHPGGVEACGGEDQDCDGENDEDGAVGCSDWYADADGDGFGDAGDLTCACGPSARHPSIDASDCDDARGDTWPGADETCDGSDQDCDGVVDEDDAVDAPTWHADADGDGFGDPGATTRACAVPSGFVADTTDCDDGDATVSPSGAEDCATEADDDCDGDTNDADALGCALWYADTDGDGYGASWDAECLCEATATYAADDGDDCDDRYPSVYPGAPDSWYDGIDSDCAGDDDYDQDGDGYAWSVDCDDTSATTFAGSVEVCATPADDDCDGVANESGASDCTVFYEDLDRDGYGDATTSACLCEAAWPYLSTTADDCDDHTGADHPGATDLCDGDDDDCDGVDHCSSPTSLSGADARLLGSSDWSGRSIAFAGDVDGDGYGDLLVGAPLAGSSTGEAWLVAGPLSGDVDLATTATALAGLSVGDETGDAVATGDLDGDGDVELVVGAPEVGASVGAVLLFDGAVETSDIDGASGTFGSSLAVVPDADGDGLDELFVGAPDYASNEGAVYRFADATPASDTGDATLTITGAATTDSFGASLACAGDTDGDGVRELIASTSGWTGAAYVFAGDRTGSITHAAADFAISGGGSTVTTVAAAGDVDADGYDDVLVTASTAWVDTSMQGVAWVLTGPLAVSGTVSDAAVRYTGEQQFAQLGIGARGVGDLDGDGRDDVAVTADRTAGTMSAGLYVFLSGATGTVQAADADATWSEATANELVSPHALAAGDVDGDGVSDVILGAWQVSTAYVLSGGGL